MADDATDSNNQTPTRPDEGHAINIGGKDFRKEIIEDKPLKAPPKPVGRGGRTRR
jgi:hypothetical protein